MRRLLLCSLLAGLCSTGVAKSGEITEKTTYFMVKGSTFADIDKALGLKGPLLSGGERRAGATQVSFSADFRYDERKGGCRVQRTNLRLDLHTTLPRWSAPKSADVRTRTMWKILHRDIAAHETRHSEIAKTWMRRMERELTGLSAQPTCARMEMLASRRSSELLLGHEQAQRDFDRTEARVIDSRLARKLADAGR